MALVVTALRPSRSRRSTWFGLSSLAQMKRQVAVHGARDTAPNRMTSMLYYSVQQLWRLCGNNQGLSLHSRKNRR